MISAVDDSGSFPNSSMDRFLRPRRDGGLRVSIADSTMMWTVHEEMQRAHEKVKTKDSTARLNEISKFYQLAVIQLDVCHRFVQQETEDDHHRDLLDDLASIRDHLRGRLVESEAAIAEKDRELMEMAENESRLRKALEAKEREVVVLRSRLSSPRWIEDIEELVDWRVEDETSEAGGGGGARVERMMMVSDIDAFKETLDVAFEKMREAIVMAKMEPSDQMLMSTVERDVVVTSVKEFAAEVNASFEVEWRRRLSMIEDLGSVEKERDCSDLDNIADDSENIESRVSELLSAFTRLVLVKLTEHTARFEDLKQRMASCMEQVTSLRRKEQLYRKAFVVRSQNLQKAENEVDLLGDQVDRLLDLLKLVYAKLRESSPILRQHFEVSELLASIRRELKYPAS